MASSSSCTPRRTLAQAFSVCCFLSWVSSKSSITFSHGAHGMAFSGHARWLGPGHPRATSAVSPMATCIAAVSSVQHRRGWQSWKQHWRLSTVWMPKAESLRAALKRAKEMKVQPVVQIKECEGFLSRARAHLAELDAKRTTVSANIQDAVKRLEALKEVQKFAPPPPVDPDAELRAVGTRRGRQDRQHPGPCSTTVAARSCSWDDAIDGDEHCELRSTYGLREVRVGEASAPGSSPDPQHEAVVEHAD